jgi:ribosomal protein S18 acetylase RimI-like enzyme
MLPTQHHNRKMPNSINISFRIADTNQEFAAGASLFQQYAGFIGIDLSFQNFAEELNTIDKQYMKPQGSLIIAYDGTKAIACVALRRWDIETAELKRMFVLQEYQGHKIGLRLLEQILGIAQKLGYKKVRLDTLSSMEAALKLYRSFGFYEIPAYRFSPIEETIYMEKVLQQNNSTF